MRRVGVTELPLHYGRAPMWLVNRMIGLAQAIATIIVENYGANEFLNRLANPFWFQSLGCCLGYDYHSSGVTTVLTGVLKSALTPTEHELAVAGGKGRASRRCPAEIDEMGRAFGWSDDEIEALRYASRMSAKVDNSAIQDGYPLYHHAFFASKEGRWVVIQQGMCTEDRSARRYHWRSDRIKGFVEEPHEAVACNVVREKVLNMTAGESDECRRTSVDLVNDGPRHLKRIFDSLRMRGQESLDRWLPQAYRRGSFEVLSMPWNVNWRALEQAYEVQPRDYEGLLSVRGVGSSTVRGLAYVSELIYDRGPSWRDPVKYSFAYGGKDGVPRPVDRRAMDESIEFLREALEEAEIGRQEKLEAFKRLRRLASSSRQP